jgi:hypothetical protein
MDEEDADDVRLLVALVQREQLSAPAEAANKVRSGELQLSERAR